MEMYFIFFLFSIPVSYGSVATSPIFDFVLYKIDCGCDRRDDLNVSKVNIRMRNYETGAYEVYPIDTAAESIMNRDDFNPEQCLSIFVPGFGDGETDDAWCYFSNIDCNGTKPLALMPDHSAYTDGNALEDLAIIALYKKAVKYTKSIGVQLGNFLVKLLTEVDRSNIDIFGHSLGAHIVGYMAEVVKNVTEVPLKVINGVDPAGPCFTECLEENFRSGQADVVKAYHCNKDMFGTSLEVSDYDFVSYNGKTQKYCGGGTYELIFSVLNSKCSHNLCVPIVTNPDIYRNESIWNAVKCASYANYKSGACDNNERTQVGYRLETNATLGTYYFSPTTNLTCNRVSKLL